MGSGVSATPARLLENELRLADPNPARPRDEQGEEEGRRWHQQHGGAAVSVHGRWCHKPFRLDFLYM